MILALINSKGGVAKTTTTVNLGAALAQAGRRVLICDLDSQASASFSLGVARGDLEPSIAAALLDEVPLSMLIRPVAPNLDLVSGSMSLASVDVALSDVAGREKRLAGILESARQSYDFILLDCPPSLSLLPINALVAADRFLVPVTPHYLALEGLVNLFAAVERMKSGGLPCAELLGIVLTQADYRAKMTGEIAAMIRAHYGEAVFASEIRLNVKITEAPSFGQSVITYAPASPGANAYRFLAGEVLGRTQSGQKSKIKNGKMHKIKEVKK